MKNLQAGGEILIVGSGSMACLFAYKLAMAGSHISMFGAWREGIDALQKRGVTLVAGDGTAQSIPLVRATGNPTQLERYDLVLFLNKTYQLKESLDALGHWWNRNKYPGTVFVTLQNGLGNCEKIIERFGANQCFGGTTTYAASLVKPGCVKQTGDGQVDLPMALMAAPASQWLKTAGFITMGHIEIKELLWRKLVINSVINPLTAIYRITNGELLHSQGIRELIIKVVDEVILVAQSDGICLDRDEMLNAVEKVCNQTAQNISSMRKDLERGNRTEIEAINGAVVTKAQLAGIPVPVNQWLLTQIKEKAG